jgi:hypothetical protein
MADTNLNITVTTDSTALKALVAQLNAGTITQAAYNKTIRDLKAASVVGSQAAMDLKNVIGQVSEQTLTYQGQIMKSYFSTGEALRTQAAGERGLTDTIRSARQERRMYMFAVREGEQAITSLIGAENGLMKATTAGASSVFGIKFALDMLGGTISRFALPIALLVGAFTILKEIFKDNSKEAAEFNKNMKKMSDDIIDNLQKMGRVTLQQIINLRELELAGIESEQSRLEKEAQKRTPSLKFFTSTGSGLAERFSILKLVYEQDAKAGAALETIYASRAAKEEQIFELKKKQTEEIDKQTRALQKQEDDRAKAFEKQQTEAWAMAETFRVGLNALNPAKKKGSPTPIIDLGATKGQKSFSEQFADEFSKSEKSAQMFTRVLDQGISHSINLLAEGFAKAFGLGNSLADKLLEQMLSIAVQMAETYALESAAMALTAGATGNIFTALGAMLFDEGGWVNEPVVGRGMKSGRPYGIAMNGVPEHISTVNQMGAGRGSGGGMMQPVFIVTNEISAGKFATFIESGDRINRRRRI